ncbi:HDOD domain-containing protein [Catenovulum sediminis]|uniref:HDOD domain-containing protein n=1 Tax=Catenovulum sediminis TaxID=1740262 RepID=UPI0011817688|nr:HDOD domain-containing protein [Catenovulum sediminis]
MKIEDYIVEAGSLCALPDTCQRIQELLECEKSSMDDIAEVLSYDPLLTSHVLKLANSALYNFSFQIDTVNKAVSVLGIDAIYNLVLASGTTEALGRLDTSAIDLDRHWRNSINAALIFKRFAKQAKFKNADSLFVVGLLHNVGELIVAQVMPDLAAKCQSYTDNILPHDKQLEILGFTYAELGSSLFQYWKLPKFMVNLTLNQHIPGYSTEQQMMHLATRLALLSTHPDMYVQEQLLEEDVIKKLGYSQTEIDAAIDWANIGAFSVFAIVNPVSNSIY